MKYMVSLFEKSCANMLGVVFICFVAGGVVHIVVHIGANMFEITRISSMHLWAAARATGRLC